MTTMQLHRIFLMLMHTYFSSQKVRFIDSAGFLSPLSDVLTMAQWDVNTLPVPRPARNRFAGDWRQQGWDVLTWLG